MRVVLACHLCITGYGLTFYIASGRAITTSVQAASARCQSGLFVCSVRLSPTMINPSFGRVQATFRRRSSSTNPISPSVLQRTGENTTISPSRPWKPSIVLTTAFIVAGIVWRSNWTCREYGVRTATVVDRKRAPQMIFVLLQRLLQKRDDVPHKGYLTCVACGRSPVIFFGCAGDEDSRDDASGRDWPRK